MDHTAHGQIAVFALAALQISLFVHLSRHLEAERRWRIGADAEVQVGASLDQLAAEGWLIHHNWPKPRGGNVDHVVAGRAGVFAIETKSGSYGARDYSQAVGGALAFREAAGVRYVTPVVCVATSVEPWRQIGSIHIVRHEHLADWLRGRPVGVTKIDAIADALHDVAD